jgi:hypothetical protein
VQATGYSCSWKCGLDTELSPATLQTWNKLVCTAPQWTASACEATFTVVKGLSPILGSAKYTFFEAVTGLDQSSGPGGGGTFLTVLGGGFRNASDYKVAFIGVDTQDRAYADAYYASATSLVCVTPMWPSPAGTSQVVISRNGTTLPIVMQESLAFEFAVHGWSSATPSQGYTTGGAVLTVAGRGLSTGSADYTVAFTAGSLAVSTTCSPPASSTLILCNIPVWPHGEMRTSVSLRKGGLLVGKFGGAFSFVFRPNWSSVTPRTGAVTGNQLVLIEGSGFLRTSVDYRCVWSGNLPNGAGTHSLTTGASAINSTHISCMLPRWEKDGVRLIEQAVNVSLVKITEGDVAYIGPTTGREFEYYFAWSSAKMQNSEGVQRPQTVAASAGGTVFTVTGVGFRSDAAANYRCRFSCRDPMWCAATFVESSSARVVNSSVLVCVAPPWTGAFGDTGGVETSLSLYRYGAGLQSRRLGQMPGPALMVNQGSELVVTYTRASWDANRTFEVQSYGGETLTISGSGFCYAGQDCRSNRYMCQFQQMDNPDNFVFATQCLGARRLCSQDDPCPAGSECSSFVTALTSLSRIVSDTKIECVVPSWPYSSKRARLTLFDATASEQGITVGPQWGIASINFFSTVQRIQPTQILASQGAMMTVIGGFFDVNASDYSCVLTWNGGVNVTVAAKVLSYSKLSCPAAALTRNARASRLDVAIRKGTQGITPAGGSVTSSSTMYVPEWQGFGACSTPSGNTVCDSSYGTALGGYDLEVRFWGLDPAVQHEIRFVNSEKAYESMAVPLQMTTTSAYAVSAAKIAMTPWPYTSAVTNVSLWRRVGGVWMEIPLMNGTASVFFDFRANIFNFDKPVLPVAGCAATVCWPTILTVSGEGFNIDGKNRILTGVNMYNDLDYECIFTGQATDAVLTSFFTDLAGSGKILCAMGDSETSPRYEAQNFSLQVLYKNTPIPWSADSSQIVMFRDGFSFATCRAFLSIAPRNYDGPECFTWATATLEAVTLAGYGFWKTRQYFCRLSRGPLSVDGIKGLVLNTNEIQCFLPVWPYPAGPVRLSVYQNTSSGPREVSYDGFPGSSQGNLFYVVASWWFSTQPVASVAGGDSSGFTLDVGPDATEASRLITIRGRGFDPAAKYYVQYEGKDNTGQTVAAPATITEQMLRTPVGTQIVFPTVPAFNGYEDFVEVNVYECKPYPTSCALVAPEEGRTLSHPGANPITKLRYLGTWTTTEMPFFDLAPVQGLCKPYGNTKCWLPGVGGAKLQVNGRGFKAGAGAKYTCGLISAADQSKVSAQSSPVAQDDDANTVICSMPIWPHAPGLVKLSVMSYDSVTGTMRAMRQHSAYDPMTFYVDSGFSHLVPSVGPSSGVTVTVNGAAFDSNVSYSCFFLSQNASGAHLPWQTVSVHASYVDNSHLTCALGDAWGGQYPAGLADVVVLRNPGFKLQDDLLSTAQTLVISSLDAFTLADGTTMTKVRTGMYLLVDSEIMLVQSVDTATNLVTVRRAMRGTFAAQHFKNDTVYLLLSQRTDTQASRFQFLPSFARVESQYPVSNDTALAYGGTVVKVHGRGLNATYLSSNRTLLGTQATGLPVQLTTVSSTGVYEYLGVMFDVYANRSLTITTLEFAAASVGQGKFWIYMVTCSTGQLDCGFDSRKEDLRLWTPLTNATDGVNITVPSNLRASFNISVHLAGGKTLGFLIYGEEGISYANDQVQGVSCPRPGQVCTEWSDGFLSIRPGVLAPTESYTTSSQPALLGKSPVLTGNFFAGNIKYTTDEIVGSTYRCRFTDLATGRFTDSLPTRAFAKATNQLAVTMEVLCGVPQWPHTETQTDFTLMDESNQPIRFSEPRAGVTARQQFGLMSHWQRLVGPTGGLALGGDQLDIYGFGFDNDTSAQTAYVCEFVDAGGFRARSDVTVTNRTHVTCLTPAWETSHAITNVDIMRVSGPYSGTKLMWAPRTQAMVWTVGTPDLFTCTGAQCNTGNPASINVCQNSPCTATYHVPETSNYTGRTFLYREGLLGTVRPSRGPSEGKTIVSVLGSGFEQQSRYLCHFSALHGSSDSVFAVGTSSLDSTAVLCLTPNGTESWATRYRSSSFQALPQFVSDGVARTTNVSVYKLYGNTTVTAAIAAGANAAITLAHAVPAGLNTQYALIDGEVIKYTTGNPATQLQATQRGLFGSADAAHANGAKLYFLSQLQGSGGFYGFTFPSWIGVTRNWTYARGGYTITVIGQDFELGATDYKCVVRSRTSSYMLELAGTVADSVTLRCVMKPWINSSQVATLDVVKGSATLFRPDGALDFEIVSGWDALSLPASTGPAAGQWIVGINGFGFHLARTYKCIFERLPTEKLNTSATVVNTTYIECQAPAWGAKYPATGGRVRVQVWFDVNSAAISFANGRDDASYACSNTPNCSVGFYANWVGLSSNSPSRGGAEGGTAITIQGFGFDPEREHFCKFTAANGRTAQSSRVYTSSGSNTTQLVCTTPYWQYAQASTVLSVYQYNTTQLVAHESADVIYNFSTSWVAKSQDAGVAKGGDILRISGAGFDPALSYVCRFERSPGGDTNDSAPVSAYADHTGLDCVVPAWRYAHGDITLKIVQGSNVVAASVSAPANATIYTFQQGWDGIIAGQRAAAQGGSGLRLDVYGFNASSTYRCVFERNGSQVMYSALVVPASTISYTCVTPSWGANFSASGGNVALRLEEKQGSTYVDVMYTGGSLTSAVCAFSDTCSMHFYPNWVALSSSTPTQGGAEGGTTMTIEGFGFDSTREHFCKFTAADGRTAESARVYTSLQATTTVLVCSTPLWPYTEAPTVVTVYEVVVTYVLENRIVDASGTIAQVLVNSSQETLVARDAAGNVSFAFFTTWSAKSMPGGVAKGGDVLEIYGAGFNESANYVCRFQRGANQNDSAVAVPRTDYMGLTCVVPFWDFRHGNVTLKIMQGTRVIAVGVSAAADTSVFTYLPGWDRIVSGQNPAAEGGSDLVLETYGLNVLVKYRCKFERGSSEVLNSAWAHPSSTTSFTCVVPSWGTTYPAAGGNVGLYIEEQTTPVTRIEYTGGGMTTVQCGGAESCSIKFYTNWVAFTQTSPTQGGAGEYKTITVRGYGFDPSEGYYCKFTSSDGVFTAVSGDSYSSGETGTTLLECITPLWNYTESYTNLSVHTGDSGKVSGPLEDKLFKFIHHWNTKSLSVALAKGGETLNFTGAGFHHDTRYICVFTSEEAFTEAYASLSADKKYVNCTVPTWPHAATTVNVSIESNGLPLAAFGSESLRMEHGWDTIRLSNGQSASGPASGDTPIQIAAYGLAVGLRYAGVMFNGSNEVPFNMTATAHNMLQGSTPAWGALFTAPRIAQIRFTGPYGASRYVTSDLVFTRGTLKVMAAGSCATTACVFNFSDVYSSAATLPWPIPAGGGITLTIAGFGFDSARRYTVDLVQGNVSQSYASPVVHSVKELHIVRFDWDNPFVPAAVLGVYAHNTTLLQDVGPTTRAIVQNFTIITPNRSSAAPGTLLHVTGYGFDVSQSSSYRCAFWDDLGSKPLFTNASVHDSKHLSCRSPEWASAQREARFGVYLSAANIAGSHYLTFTFYPLVKAFTPAFGDRLGGINSGKSPAITVTGFGFNAEFLYKCGFARGATKLYSVSRVPVDQNKLVCIMPRWETSPDESTEFTDISSVISFEEETGSGHPGVGVITTNLSSTAFKIVHINKAPFFKGGSFVEAPAGQAVTLNAWATDIAPGAYDDGTTADVFESEQSLEFVVSKSDLLVKRFEVYPSIDSVTGTLTFRARAGSAGVYSVEVYLKDDGGTAYGGIDRTKPYVFTMTIYPEELALQNPTYKNLTVNESSGKHLYAFFFSEALTMPSDFISDVKLALYNEEASPSYFDENPSLTQDGTLSFTLRPYAFGQTYFIIERNKTDVTTGRLSRSTHKVTLTINSVNDPPSFRLIDSAVYFDEDECRAGADPCSYQLATSILRGPDIALSGHKDEDWSESLQQLTFTVTGNGNGIFAATPSVSESGVLTFHLVNDANGWASFTLTLKDGSSGQDTSGKLTFGINIRPVNDEPHFSYVCSGWGPSGPSCTGACQGVVADSSCEVEISILQNCAAQSCAFDSMTPHGCYSLGGLVTAAKPSLTAWPDEALQSIGFDLITASETSPGMLQTASIDANTGRLRYAIMLVFSAGLFQCCPCVELRMHASAKRLPQHVFVRTEATNQLAIFLSIGPFYVLHGLVCSRDTFLHAETLLSSLFLTCLCHQACIPTYFMVCFCHRARKNMR